MKWRRKKKEPEQARPLGQGVPKKIQEILPPEGVPLRFELAPLGGRFGAQILDILITVIGLVALVVFMLATNIIDWLAIISVGAVLFFLIRVPYYAFCEMIWNGQTVGKRICKIRVVSGTGRSLTTHQVVSRNLMREMEIFMPGTLLLAGSSSFFEGLITFLWVGGVLLVPILNKRNQRLGDIIANTYVIECPVALLYPDIAAEAPEATEAEYEFFPNQMDHYGAYELQVLAELLQDNANLTPGSGQRRASNLESVGKRIRKKIDYAYPVAFRDEETFLKAFYRAQRAYLEQKKLFGDSREDKFHQTESKEAPTA